MTDKPDPQFRLASPDAPNVPAKKMPGKGPYRLKLSKAQWEAVADGRTL